MVDVLALALMTAGFGIAGASAFTTAYSRRWGARGGQVATAVLRNLLGIPLLGLGVLLAWLADEPLLFTSPVPLQAAAWVVALAAFSVVLWAHWVLGLATHFPSVQDPLVRTNIYAHVRHPIYASMVLAFTAIILVKPTLTMVLALGLGMIWANVQARLEEHDLVQRLPGYAQYMRDVPRFVPSFHRRRGS